MFDNLFDVLTSIDRFLWSYIGVGVSILTGLYFTIKTRFYQLRVLMQPKKSITAIFDNHDSSRRGTNPFRLYFASIGGMVGLGNLVAVISALLLGGPGSLFWLWIASFTGMAVKYAEVYIGITHRVQNGNGGYTGGPMYFLPKAFGVNWIAPLVAVLLCIYGVEIYQFLVITDAVSGAFDWGRFYVLAALLIGVVFVGIGGIDRLATVCSFMMPGLLFGYVAMCIWILIVHAPEIPSAFATIFKAAFEGHAPIGGFAGSTLMMAAQYGVSRGVYSGDIGVGFDASIQSNTQSVLPEHQAQLGIFALFTDTFICTLSILVVLVTGVWTTTPQLDASHYVANALSTVFPHMNIFMAVFFFLAGFTTVIAYFTVGLSSAVFVSKKWGKPLYLLYGIIAFTFFSFFEQSNVLTVMSIAGALLMMINTLGFFKLRKHIEFKL